MLASSSSCFFSSSRQARLFAGLARGEVSIAGSLEPLSLDDSSAFLLAPLSDALLHQQQGRSAQLRKAKIKQEQGSKFKNLPAAATQRELQLQGRGRWSPRASTRGRHFPAQLAQHLGRLLLGLAAGRC